MSCVIETHEDTADSIIRAICILHNIIIDRDSYLLNILDLPPIPERCNLQRSRLHNALTTSKTNSSKIYRIFCGQSFKFTIIICCTGLRNNSNNKCYT